MMLIVSDIERVVLAEPITYQITNIENKRITQTFFNTNKRNFAR